MAIKECIFFELTSSARKASKYWKKSVDDLGITGVQAMVINALSEQNQITSMQLGQRVQLDSATMTGLLDRLEKSGLIQRIADEKDRRAVRVSLTDSGIETARQVQQRQLEANKSFMQKLDKEEVKTLKLLLSKL